jgi:phospholipid/cholesterol/gamma-HCH transport system substrate-binding protein
MPDARKVTWAQLRVGIIAVVAMVILGVLIFLLTGSGGLFSSNSSLYTYMDDSASMAPSTPVHLNGITIGKIDRIDFSGLKEKGKIVVVTMKVRTSMLAQIPEDSVAGVDASNLLGDKYINITKGKSPVTVKDKATLNSEAVADIPEMMKRAGDMLGSLQVIINRFDALLASIENGSGTIGKFVKDPELYNQLTDAAKEVHTLATSLTNGKGTLGHLINDDELYQELRSPIKRVDTMLADLQQGQGTAGKLLKDPALYDEAQKTIADLHRLIDVDFRKIVDDLNAGKGTAGKLLKDDELYRRMNQLVNNLGSTVDKINSGQGTLGQLLVNPQLYEGLNGVTREAQSLIQAIHENPKKFLRIKLGLF